ncbi:asparagine synthase (glutamine-hydrolyzing) [Fulvimonas yonginensis]|uniref:asparagine synthase (glutamine-hydrolyzing) n=1 Tax=Fulvimonas yonginensis TaxID=1495200 RepID=A0ABU8JFW2_9GAMM
MCGLAGLLLPSPQRHGDELAALAGAMGDALAHRGPDDRGVWVDAQAGIALAHRRLSILDLSPLGHQPMASADGRYVLAYNGEIYNFAELRAELEARGAGFRGHSDTEVLLAAVVAWGVEESLRRCNGMFALALWDRHERCLWLARDRVGKKPLYYGWAGDALVFGSELKALWQHPEFDNGIDRDALTLLLRLDYIPAPHCIHERSFKLMPGHVLRMDAAAVLAGASAHRPAQAQRPFWDARERMRAALAAPFEGSDAEAEQRLDALLRDAVALRMVADVPVGVFLSGGTDSSIVTSMMQAQSGRPVHSFSIGFEGSHHDEAPLAREVAEHLHTDHTELYVSGADALAVVPRLPAMFDEPFADASQVPTALVAKLARGGVTVALSGDGGDELFFGYSRYRRALRNWRMLSRVPAALRRSLARIARGQGEASRGGGLPALLAEMGARGIGDVYRNRVTRWRDPVAVVPGARAIDSFYGQADPLDGTGTPADAMMLADFVTYLPDDLLCKVDRTSMAVSLEARAPLLDWRVAEFAWSLPLHMKLRGGESKYLLKKVLLRYLPAAMVYRGKRGFGAPVTAWLRGDLREWADDLLSPERLAADGLLDAHAIGALWRRFAQGERKWHTHLWNVLMFQAWEDYWRQSRARVRGAPVSPVG